MENKKEKFTLKQFRKFKGISIPELSNETSINENTLYNYENSIVALRKASYERLDQIASALGITVNDIFLSPNTETPKKSLISA